MAVRKFGLEQVLGYRREMEKLRKQELAMSRKNLEQANNELQREKALADELSKEFRARQQELGCIDEMRMYADFFTRKREEIKNHTELVHQLGVVVDERREYLLEASKDKKMLESLKARKTSEFSRETGRRESNFIDEISLQQKVRA